MHMHYLWLPSHVVYFAHAGAASGSSAAAHVHLPEGEKKGVKVPEGVGEDPETDRSKMSSEELKNDLQRLIQNLDIPEAKKTLSAIEARDDISSESKEKYIRLLSLAGQFLEGQKPILQDIKNLGRTSFGNTKSIVESAMKLSNALLPHITALADPVTSSLEQHCHDLLLAAQQAHDINKNLDALISLSNDYHVQKNMTTQEILRRWEGIRNNFVDINKATKDILPEYSEIHVIATHLLEGNSPELSALVQFVLFIKALEMYREVSNEITDVDTLRKKLSSDLGVENIKLEGGCDFKIQGDIYRIESASINHLLVWPGKRMSPAEVYIAMLMASGYGTSTTEKKVVGEYIPAIKTLADLEKYLKLEENKHLEKGILIENPKGIRYNIHDINHLKGTITTSQKTTVMEDGEPKEVVKIVEYPFRDFLNFWMKGKLNYRGRDYIHPQTSSPISNIGEGSKWPHLMSVAGAVQAIKWIKESTLRMSTERTEIDASNFSKKLAKKLDNIPWYRGIGNISETSNYNIVMEKINKWIEQYTKGLKTPEFQKEWEIFHKHNKIRQVAMCAVAGMKGASEEEIYWKIGGSKDRRPTHTEYVDQVYKYFCEGPEALPKKVESVISKHLNEGYDTEIKKGIGDTVAMADGEEMLEMLRAHVGYYKDDQAKRNYFKRLRTWGDTISLLKLGCDERQFGIATLWNFKLIESGYANPDGTRDANTWSEEQMRKTGNIGKAIVPMLGLLRFPKGMAIARALIDFYRTVPGGGDPFEPRSVHEDIMGLLFAGRFKKAAEEHRLKEKLGEENYKRLEYLYMKARAFAIQVSEAASFGFDYGEGRYLDESTLDTAYGVGGMLSSTWIQTVLETDTNGQPVTKWDNQTQGWWQGLEKGRLEEVSEDERIIFAMNFLKSFYMTRDAGQVYYLKRYAPTIFKILKYIKIGPNCKIAWTDSKNKEYTASSIDEIEAIWKERKLADPNWDIIGIKYPREQSDPEGGFEKVTFESLSNTMQQFMSSGIYTSDLNLDIKHETSKVIKESEDYLQHERSDSGKTYAEMKAVQEAVKKLIKD